MKKIAIIAMMIFSMVLTVSAQQSVDGNYVGNFTSIYMNGDKPVPSGQFTTTVTSNNSLISLYMAPFQIGNMPGYITIDAQNIVLNSDGSFNQSVYNGIILQLPFGTKRYNATVTGTVVNNELIYTITSENASYMGYNFLAIVGFRGNK
ncbi:hypothetical protein [Bacteroides heparinolyticus]|uniref:hypothetical protein n=1 Tax=Prevotella heparinolytica TaxID=28113 RepID=UPI0035A13A3B